ncbi:hypothetical protein NEOLEDRAFT_1175469 [Neolentinus lepideus HHB14362 ss-1]|uniref:cAMP-independent regulatory protein pac2 n=1 Tax=Neolentinus lepideus HHB14362 ss-1 TaxID=1314782 RepID=A0A165V520_9AGAM|nr:hypothetical protein NEOLEDRAFT_1175469 [Neolentinus lepideus HHB14362 ss-1]
MQSPTCTGIRIRSTHDANVLFHAVALNILPMVVRRLDSDARMALCSGCAYVWEERCHGLPEGSEPGIERFTDGRSWGPSRARDDFLFYYEKPSPSKSLAVGTSKALKRQTMIKQTYSVYVNTPTGLRKWHLNAYYTQETVDQLITVDDIPSIKNLVVPESYYICARASRSRDVAAKTNQYLSMGYDTPIQSAQGRFFAFSASPSPRPSDSDTDATCVGSPVSPAVTKDAVGPKCSFSPDPSRIQLVPLEYLQSIARHRDPVDDEALRVLSRRSMAR